MMADLLIKPNDLDLDGVASLTQLQDSWNGLIRFIDPTDKKVGDTG